MKAQPQLLKRQPSDENGLMFSAPWQAKSFAMAVHLHERGMFSWPEWGKILSGEIAEFERGGGTVDDDQYYLLWQQALEKILGQRI